MNRLRKSVHSTGCFGTAQYAEITSRRVEDAQPSVSLAHLFKPFRLRLFAEGGHLCVPLPVR